MSSPVNRKRANRCRAAGISRSLISSTCSRIVFSGSSQSCFCGRVADAQAGPQAYVSRERIDLAQHSTQESSSCPSRWAPAEPHAVLAAPGTRLYKEVKGAFLVARRRPAQHPACPDSRSAPLRSSSTLSPERSEVLMRRWIFCSVGGGPTRSSRSSRVSRPLACLLRCPAL